MRIRSWGSEKAEKSEKKWLEKIVITHEEKFPEGIGEVAHQETKG
jgi:hypothetical protein